MTHPFIDRQRRRREKERESLELRALLDVERQGLGLQRLKQDLMRALDAEVESDRRIIHALGKLN